MKFNLPEYKKYHKVLSDRLRGQLQKTVWFVKLCQILVGLILPLIEAVLVNLATGTDKSITPYVASLIAIGFVHLVLLAIVLVVETPLPQFLVQFDDLENKLQISKAEVTTYQSYSITFIEAINASLFSMTEIENMTKNPEEDLSKIFERILYPWIEQRTDIFWFREGDALYNFAVYLESEPNILTVKYRSHDNRILPTNRSWEKGDGHVGSCFLRGETIFLFVTDDNGLPDTLKTSKPRPEDRIYYISMMATPIIVDEITKGVLVITSNKTEQFDKALHAPIIDIMGRLLAQSLKNCWKEQKDGDKNKQLRRKSSRNKQSPENP